MSRLIDTSWHPLADGIPPDWASTWGQDRFGVYVGFTIGQVTQRLRWIPPGRFEMGSPKDEAGRSSTEGPRHAATILQGFWLFDTACTEALWEAVTGKLTGRPRGPGFPVTNVSWDDVRAFIGQVNAMKPGLDLVLPSEAQWEYACRAGTETAYSFGATITERQVRFGKGYSDGPVPVGGLPANPWGLREMHGNVFEWCEDHWHDSYDGAPTDGSAWIDANRGAADRVLRGGSGLGGARSVRSAVRDHFAPAFRSGLIGFRCARVQ